MRQVGIVVAYGTINKEGHGIETHCVEVVVVSNALQLMKGVKGEIVDYLCEVDGPINVGKTNFSQLGGIVIVGPRLVPIPSFRLNCIAKDLKGMAV
jgi:hypothetical protein